MFQSEKEWLEVGDLLAKEFNKYLVFLKSEIFHENLPKSLQEMADKGLGSITGMNMEKWKCFGENIQEKVQMSECISKEQLVEWRRVQKLKQFLELIPKESNKFYDDIDDEMISIYQQGNDLLEKLLCWLDMEN